VEAIPPNEEAASVATALATATPFRQSTDPDARAIADLLDCVGTMVASTTELE
jgi:hypothetical protein